MARFPTNDPRHPHNRIRLLYHAAMKCPGPGVEIAPGDLRVLIKLATNVTVQRAVSDYRLDLIDFRVIEPKGDGFAFRKNGLTLLD